ncbi:LysE family translocator [Ammoniphilus sp. CFH 90114]|uniref:LysE family translocator n=1 Tax=Ammoniphilus sp. CFH 90114 TaxID=2493665 RepID=UPI00100E12AF|nr:LysE family translocator [Ammoniphilus sp. CFH 90114]RXT06345.1 LysE family translocator [Ammoniphilus sp. CFH 90114]
MIDSWLLSYIIVSIMIVLIPGQDMLFVLTQSISSGNKAGIKTVLGSITGTLVHTILAAAGLSIIFQKSIVAFNILKFVGVIYLLYLAIQSFREKGTIALQPQNGSSRGYFKKGMIMNLSNPKVAIFFLTFLPQFVDPTRGHAGVQMLLFGFIFILETLIIFTIISIFASKLGERMTGSNLFMRGLKYFKGTAFGSLGLKLLLSSK